MSGKSLGTWERIGVIVAVAALVVSLFALYKADEANQIANQANQITRQINLPIISAIIQFAHDEKESVTNETAKIIVNNGGQPLKNFLCSPHSLMKIENSMSSDRVLYLPFPCFEYWNPLYSVSSQGILCTIPLDKKYYGIPTIWSDFFKAEQNDGYSSIMLDFEIILDISYSDQFGQYHQEYLEVTTNGSYQVQDKNANDMINSSFRDVVLLNNQNIDLGNPNGKELWNCYKIYILKK